MKLYSDNKSTIRIVHNPIQHDGMKHVRIDRHFIKIEIEKWTVILSYIPTQDQEANILAKAMSKPSFNVLINKMRMINIYSPAWEGVLEYQEKEIRVGKSKFWTWMRLRDKVGWR